MQEFGESTQLSLTGRRWLWPTLSLERTCPQNEGFPVWVAEILGRRGIIGRQAVESYLAPTLAALKDPHCIEDVDRAVDRLLQAKSAGESVVVYGDYDVDGVCSTTILVEFLRDVGLNVSYYIPDRRAEGYGLNSAAIADLATRHQLLVTVDCGITAFAEIDLAQKRGLDVIVVDHHQVPEQLPPAVACLNPHRLDCAYPFKDLCAAGVAFMLAAVMRSRMRQANSFAGKTEPDMRRWLDLVAVATVADLVPLCATNRILVAAGLKRMRHNMRPGLQALCAVAKVQTARMNATDLGFRIGPRINARGRMSQAALAVDLLLCADKATAEPLAALLDAANEERRKVQRMTVDAALAQVETLGLHAHAALVVHDPAWHPGVLGLVASRLVSCYHRPAVVIGEGGKGSGRSVEAVDLHAALTSVRHHLLRFGGHPAAAGLTLAPDCLAAFRTDLAAAVHRRLGPPPFAPILRPDLEVNASHLDIAFLSDLERLAPFGQGNPEPILGARNIAVQDKRCVGGTHLKLRLGTTHQDAIAFGMGHLLACVPECVDVLFHLERHIFRGRQTLQMRIVDLRLCTPTAPLHVTH